MHEFAPNDEAVFQSTLPMKGATGDHWQSFNGGIVSIHAPNEGSDHLMRYSPTLAIQFQSTLPMKGATR